ASGRTVVRDLSFARGDTVVTMDFEVVASGSQSDIEFKHASLITPQEEWNAVRPFHLVITEQGATIDSVLLSSPRGSIGLQGSYSKQSNQCRVSGWGESIDLSILRDAFGLPIRFEGQSRFDLSITGEVDNPQVMLSLSLQKGAIDSLSFDGLYLQGGFTTTGGYRLDRMTIASAGDTLIASGTWNFDQSPVRLVREGIDSEQFVNQLFQLHLQSKHFSLRDAAKAIHSQWRHSGYFSGNVILANTPKHPVIRIVGTISDDERVGVHLPPMDIELVYQDSLLSVDRFQFDDGKSSGTATGTIPLVFSLSEGVRVRDNSMVNLNGAFVSEDLTSFATYSDRIAKLAGRMSGKLSIAGQMKQPSYIGQFSFSDCRLRLFGMNEVYESINARFELNNRRIQLVSLTGREGKNGTFQGTGHATLKGFKLAEYEISVNFSDFVLTSIYDFSSTQSGNIRVHSVQRDDGKLIPNITGSVEVKEAQILRLLGESGGAGSTSTPTASPDWLCNIDLKAQKNVWVKNPDLKMELGGEVVLKRDERGLYLRGELEALRGSYMIYNNKFKITDGTFDFSKTNTLRPELFLNAYTPYRREGEREHRIYLNLSWPSDKQEPQATLTYDEPGYSETDIWKMLGGTYVSPANGQGGDTWDAAGAAQGIATNYLERILNAQMTDVTIDVETGAVGGRSYSSVGEGELSIAVGKYLSEDLYLRYRQGISWRSEREVDIEYRISNMIIIRSEIIRHSGKQFIGQRRQATDEINLDIKLRYEY
ncbi:MAG: translocation/assembly module TamB domain-containing protein, partial [Candidatus Latescibacterota bacterium]